MTSVGLQASAPPVGGGIRRTWTTALVFGELVGFVPPALVGAGLLIADAGIVLVVIGSLLALFSMGYLQWLVLRRVASDSGRWISVTALAWLIGVPIPIVALSVIPDGWPLNGRVVIAVAAAAAMGITVGLITGQTLQQLADDPNDPVHHERGRAGGGPATETGTRRFDPDLLMLPLKFAWTTVSCFVVVSTVFGLAALPATIFYQWHLGLELGPRPLRLFLLAAAFIPAYTIFALLYMLLSAESARLLRWRPPRTADLRIAELPRGLRNWARYAIMSHLVHVLAGVFFRSTPVWVWYMRRNGAKIGKHVWINSLQVGDDCLLEFGDEVVIGAGVHMSGHTVERGLLRLAPISLGPGTTVGLGTHVGIGVTTGRKTQIASMAVVPKYAELESETTYAGIPVRPLAESDRKEGQQSS